MQSHTQSPTNAPSASDRSQAGTSPDALRRKFLEFFRSKGHLIYPSAPLKSDDPGLLFNVAGMQQFKPYFQGATPKFPGVEGVWPRVATSQKCMRAGGKDSDIENVGRTRRHHTFFEMLGNFSFGDYFKREAIGWAWEFLTAPEWLGLDPERLYATVYLDDDEAYNIWKDEVGLPEARLSRFGEGENFWPANAIKDERSGPCGPCSEIFYDRGPAYGSPDETGPNTGSGDRFVEIWNLVFTQFNLENGVLTPLPQQNIDTGAGLERFAAVIADVKDAYATELFQPIIRRLERLSGVPYRDLESVHHRIIADHVRSVSMCIADGILPANDGAGYVIKMLLRRASRQAYLLGLREPVLHQLVSGVVEAMGEAYPEVKDAQARIEGIVRAEEESFLRTLESGIARVSGLLDELGGDTLPGDVAFDLWQTYGFPLDLTEEMAQERGVRVDREGYAHAREAARSLSRAARGEGALFGGTDVFGQLAEAHGETAFVGYSARDAEAAVRALVQGGEAVSEAGEGTHVQVVLDTTPFYAEGGGQVGDAGVLEWRGGDHEGKALVTTTTKTKGGVVVHHARVLRGTLKTGQRVRAAVDPSRTETEKHHTATHLLHAALRSVLGTHVAQAGSLVAPERLRFDFSHPQPLSESELRRLEALVNRWIQADFTVSWRVVPLEEARAAGAMMLFGEKYGANVRMVSVTPERDPKSSVSTELCGGTHVARTGTLGVFVITGEEAVSAGVRRVEALVGEAALSYLADLRATLAAAAKSLGVTPGELGPRLERLQSDLKAAQRTAAELRDRLAAAQTAGESGLEVSEAGGFSYAVAQLGGLDASALRGAADRLLARSGADLVVVGSGPLLVVKASDAAQARGAHAGRLVGEIARRAGGGGGGRPNLAQAGVKDPAQLGRALAALPDILEHLAGGA
ncbi:alanine--tRNA ligase [Truepera radiovictrix]|uniref:Alanine--tRNA ligase n=1 Tax=Truepera radiovictrix (strain DSM 17093 / CIP 108686 / LMG 22925 / RQ-24) TaxID=649638 RepID=D7CQQ4_TRURR|nr:alanine--tRNA ligase [Truepera radiovictrix]ADI15038.1 alanyl-tRNA synthetase [Truepera radiovictrix DSM 17093]WMT56409.1 alanine--tRNA ligase [Truepera radiovictrix]